MVWDEVKYEGNISTPWGALSGVEEADRFWMGAAKGVHVGHSDTTLDWRLDAHDDAQPLWWAKGGTPRGESPARIAWFRRQHVKGGPLAGRPPLVSSAGVAATLSNSASTFADVLTATDGSQSVLHVTRPGSWEVPLPTASQPMPAGLCAPLDGVKCEGEDIRNAGTVYHAEACCALCASDPTCRAWTWKRGSSGQANGQANGQAKGQSKACWIKTGCGTQTKGDPDVHMHMHIHIHIHIHVHIPGVALRPRAILMWSPASARRQQLQRHPRRPATASTCGYMTSGR